MTILIAAITVIVLLLALGIDFGLIAAGILILLTAILAAITIFFVCCAVLLVFSKPCSGELSEIRKVGKNSFDCAFYNVDGDEYRNIFPCEVVMKKYLYRKGRNVKLRLVKNKKLVFDPNAKVCTAAGLVLGAVSLIAVGNIAFDFLTQTVF